MVKLANNFNYRVQAEKDISELCQKFNTCKENIIRNNSSIPLFEGEILKIRVNEYITHIVKPTENLDFVANYYQKSKEKILLDNDLKTDKLFIGQRLKIF